MYDLPSDDQDPKLLLRKELQELHRKIADADNGIGPKIGDELRTQLYRRINLIDAALTPASAREEEFVEAPRSPWQGFTR